MVSLKEVRVHNATLKSLSPGLVAIFVGGTSGIGLSTARELVRNTQSPHVYLVGRNEAEASRIIPELQSINSSSKIDFIKSDVSLLKNVDQVCKEIKEKEKKVNLLFMTVGYVTMNGNRQDTQEGLDRKFSLHYYARMRFAQGLSPLLTAAANDADPKANLSRVVSVLDPKRGRNITTLDYSDLSLKNGFGLVSCSYHATAMNNFAMEHLAQAYPSIGVVHAYPSAVPTNVFRDVGPVMKTVLGISMTLAKPFMVNLKESGERHLFAATAPKFAPREKSEQMQNVARGSDDIVGSGSYVLNWDGEVLGESTKANEMRGQGAVEKIWKHTEDVFVKICDSDGRY